MALVNRRLRLQRVRTLRLEFEALRVHAFLPDPLIEAECGVSAARPRRWRS